MSEAPQKFYLTTPIYYVNARPHIGHAYTTIVADVIARRHRLLGDDTWFLTGTDEHGQKIERSAQSAGIPPQRFADQVSAEFRGLWDRMGLTYDQYIRTTDPAHKRGVQKLFAELQSRGHIYLSSYTGQYCVSEEIFVEGPPGTIGPDGRPTETVTEENYFFRLSTFQLPLIDLIESDQFHIRPETRKNELLSFLRGNVAAQGAGLSHSAAGNPYVSGALRDLSISRSSFTWGIPVPGDEKHVIYVWLDALANYMTAVGYGDDSVEAQARFGKYWPADLHIIGKEITRQHCIYWPAFLLAAGLPLPKAVLAHGWLLFEESKMSKSRGNIVRAETILDAFATLCPPSPTEETSASAAASGALARHQHDLFAADVLRYFLLREIPFGQDGSFSFDALITRYNADLANGYGNLVSRTLSMIDKYLGSMIPDRPNLVQEAGAPGTGITLQSIGAAGSVTTSRLKEAFGASDFSTYLLTSFTFIAATDASITSLKPWKLASDVTMEGQKRLADCLYTAAESIRIITALLYPILPYATASVWRKLGLGDIEQAARRGELKNLQWGGLIPGTKLGPLSPIFPRADKGLAQIMTDMEQNKSNMPLGANAQADSATPTRSEFAEAPIASATPDVMDPTSPAAGPRTATFAEPDPGAQVAGSTAHTTERTLPPSHTEAAPSGLFASAAAQTPITAAPSDAAPQITIDDFAKVELRVGEVLVCERIPKADKLLRLEVDLGSERRQILSGIAEWYTPEELIGRRIIVITNLAPRKMRGLDSHGMLLAASHGDSGKPILATMADSIPLGSRLK